MANTIKLRTSIIAMAIVLLCNLQGWTQSEKPIGVAPATTAKKGEIKQASESADLIYSNRGEQNLQFKMLQNLLLEKKAELQAGMESKNLNLEETNRLKETIAAIQTKINILSNNGSSTVDASKPPRTITREEFSFMTMDMQKVILTNSEYTTITDLVNATPSDLKYRQSQLFYVPLADFNNYPFYKKMQILNQPELYKIVKSSSQIPKMQISRAEFNSLSSVKQQAIKNSPDFVIAD